MVQFSGVGSLEPMIREPNVKRLLAAKVAQKDNIAL